MKRFKFTILLIALIAVPIRPAFAAQFDIIGPAGSGEFGVNVQVLPNGNIVVVDTRFDAPGPIVDPGAVYLYDGATLALISSTTGSTAHDRVGSGGIWFLANGNFLVSSPLWANASSATADVGAVTFLTPYTGLHGAVSASHS